MRGGLQRRAASCLAPSRRWRGCAPAWCRSSRRRYSASRDRRTSQAAPPATPASRRTCPRRSASPAFGITGDARGGHLVQRADVIRHELRTGGAIQPDRQQVVIGDGGVQRVDGLAAQHGAVALDGDRGHDRNVVRRSRAKAGRWPAGPLSGCRCRTRFQAAECRRRPRPAPWPVRSSSGASASNVMVAVMFRSLVVGPMEPATNRGCSGVENSSAACRASLAASTFNSCMRSSQLNSESTTLRSAEGIGLYDVRACFQVSAVDVA